MFRPTDPQTSLLECHFLIPPEKRARLERSWAHVFRHRVLDLIAEEPFRACFHGDNGRPNKSIRLLVAVHLLKEWDDLTDAQVLDNVEYNLQWHYALGIESGEAHLCQKTMHNFRVLLGRDELAREMFVGLVKGLVETDGLGVGRQRLDSTHVMSNIATLTRLALFVETATKFLRELRRRAPDKLGQLKADYVKRYLEREGYFSDAKREQARRRLPVVAQDIYALVRAFDADEEIRAWESYQLMVRLLEEQCEVVGPDEAGSAGEGPPIEVKDLTTSTPVSDDQVDSSDDDDATGLVEEEPGEEEAPATAVDPRPDAAGPEAEPVGESGTAQADAAAPASTSPLRVKEGKEITGASLQSPHDADATYGHKGKGYEVQIAETCEESNPYQVITGIDVNGANESDQHATLKMVRQLVNDGFGPDELFADTAYGSGENMVECAGYGTNLMAPVQDPDAPAPADHWAQPVEPAEPTGQATTGSEPTNDASPTRGLAEPVQPPLDLGSFRFNGTFWQVPLCPGGHAPIEQEVRDAPVPYRATFDGDRCANCPLADRCPTRPLASGDRVLKWRDANAATQTRQREQQEPDFKERYKIRSGVESTAGEDKGRHGAKKMRVRGKKAVTREAYTKAAALNVKRAVQYHVGELARKAQARAAGA